MQIKIADSFSNYSCLGKVVFCCTGFFLTIDWFGKKGTKTCTLWETTVLKRDPTECLTVNVWRLPSLVCEHISYAAWCFSVTCFSNVRLLRAWLTNGNESLICPFNFHFDYCFSPLFFYYWLEWNIPQEIVLALMWLEMQTTRLFTQHARQKSIYGWLIYLITRLYKHLKVKI